VTEGRKKRKGEMEGREKRKGEKEGRASLPSGSCM
jgi:hypothetical protein